MVSESFNSKKNCRNLNPPTEDRVRKEYHRAENFHPVVQGEPSGTVRVHHQVVGVFILKRKDFFRKQKKLKKLFHSVSERLISEKIRRSSFVALKDSSANVDFCSSSLNLSFWRFTGKNRTKSRKIP